MSEQVMLAGKIEIPVAVLVDRDLYDRWMAGSDKDAQAQIAHRLGEAASECLGDADASWLELERAVLVDDEEREIAVLEEF